MNRRLLSTSGLVLAAVLFFAVNILSEALFRSARLDLTANRLYTLSDGTRNVLARLEEPITLRFFYSAKMANSLPQMRDYAGRVRDLLEEYVALADGRLRLEVIDPEPFSDAEDRAVENGLQGVPVSASGDLFYFGLVGVNSTDDTEAIAFFQAEKEQFLEYDLTKFVYQLSEPKKPVVGVISSLPLEFGPGGIQAAMRGQSRPYGIMTSMQQFFEVRTLKGELTEVADDVDVLLLLHARSLSDQTLYAVDQFVLGGGRVILFADPYSETAAQLPPAPGAPPDPLDPQTSIPTRLLDAWGVEIAEGKLVGDRLLATKVNAGGMGRRQIVDYVAWLGLRDRVLNRDDVVTGQLGTVTVASAGALTAKEGATTTLTPLLSSSLDSMLFDVAKVRRNPDPEALIAEFEPDPGRHVIAARIGGPVASAFDGPPPKPKAAEDADKAEDDETTDTKSEPKPHRAQSDGPVNLIVVADADMIDDRFWLQRQQLLGQEFLVPTSNNADFLINGIDNLAGSNDLISLRSRARSQRPFVVIDNIRRNAEHKFLAEEKALRDKLQAAEQQVADVQSKATVGENAILTPEEAALIETSRREILATRKQLRAVQHNLRKDIESLETAVKFVNIGLVPLAVFLLAVGLAALRYRRRQATQRLRQA